MCKGIYERWYVWFGGKINMWISNYCSYLFKVWKDLSLEFGWNLCFNFNSCLCFYKGLV